MSKIKKDVSGNYQDYFDKDLSWNIEVDKFINGMLEVYS